MTANRETAGRRGSWAWYRASTAVLLAGIASCAAQGQPPRSADGVPAQRGVMTGENQRARVLEWLRQAPFGDVSAAARPDFSYDKWFADGRALPGAVDTLIELLAAEDLQHPSGDGMRIAYALGWIGDKRPAAIPALRRALGSRDIALRVEAVAAMGRQGDSGVLPLLEALLADEREDINVRANACISIGRLGVPGTEAMLRRTQQSSNRFLARCAEEALRLHAAARRPSP